MIVTIDGPAGAGKSTVAKALAQRLGFQFLDTGAMYRAVTLACLRRQVDLTDETAVFQIARHIEIGFREGRVLLSGEDVSEEIRSIAVTQETRHVAANPLVREHLVSLQRLLAANQNFVSEGRDQGTVAFPSAQCKFFLTASPRERANRRLLELLARGESVTLEQILAQQEIRDQRDEQREHGPLKPAEDALIVDTSTHSLEEVIDILEASSRERLAFA